MNLADEVLDHLLGDFEVGDDPVAHGADGFHVAGVRPSICLASMPTAWTTLRPPMLRRATTEGSFRTMPLPFI